MRGEGDLGQPYAPGSFHHGDHGLVGSRGICADDHDAVFAGTGSAAQLAHGISIALYNTAFGLIVAIPALIFWRYFRGRVDAYLLTLELASEQFVRHILRHRK